MDYCIQHWCWVLLHQTASFTLTWFGLYLHHSQVREGASPVSFVGSLCLVCVFVCICSFALDVE
jgi:hypothetical protein